MSESFAAKRPLIALVAGAVIGLVVAASGLLDTVAAPGVPAGAVARVNDALIATEEYQRLVAGLESDTKQVADEAAQRRVLDRMIEEELLVQRGLELGLAESDRRVRGNITSAMIASIVVEAEDAAPSEEELRAFYEKERQFFVQPGRMRLRQVFFRVPHGADEDAIRARATEAAERLRAGEAFAEIREELGDEPISPLPDARLPPAKVREYLGPTALRAALALRPGEIGDPLRSGMGYHVLELLEQDPPSAPAFEEITPMIEREWRRRAGDQALRRYLDDLRARADVEILPTLP